MPERMKNALTAQNSGPDSFVFSVGDISSGKRKSAWMDFVEDRFLSLKFDDLHLGGRDRIVCKTADTAKLSFIASGPQTVVLGKTPLALAFMCDGRITRRRISNEAACVLKVAPTHIGTANTASDEGNERTVGRTG